MAQRIGTVAALITLTVATLPSAHAAQWMDLATISSTITNTPGRLCVGGGRTDIGCPTNAPLLDSAAGLLTVPGDLRVTGNLFVSGSQQFDGVTFSNGGVSATGTVTATSFTGSGAGLNNIPASGIVGLNLDRIVSTSANVVVGSDGMVRFTTGGVSDTAYFDTAGRLVVPGVSATGSISATLGYFATRVGIGTSNPSTTLHVAGGMIANNSLQLRRSDKPSQPNVVNFFDTADTSSWRLGTVAAQTRFELFDDNGGGTVQSWTKGANAAIGIRTADPSTTLHVSGTLRIANGGEACDANRAGAIRYTSSSTFDFCDGVSGWRSLQSIAANAATVTTGVSGSLVFRDQSGALFATNTLVISSTNGSVGVGAAAPAYLGNNAIYSTGTIHADGSFNVTDGNKYSWGQATTYLDGTSSNPNQYLRMVTSGAEALRVISTGLIGIGTSSPVTRLDVSGSLKIANGGEACDTPRLGAIKYQSNAFYVCQSTANGWEAIGTTGENSLADRITSNSQAGVIANATGYISLTTGGVTGTVYFDRGGRLVNAGVSTTGTVSASTLFTVGRAIFNGGMLFNQGSSAVDNLINVGSTSSGPVNASFGFMVAGIGSGNSADGPYFLGRGNNFSNLAGQRGNLFFTAGVPSTPAMNEGSIQFSTGGEIRRMIIDNTGNVGIGLNTATAPATMLDVSGSIRMSSGNETCDTAHLGSIRYATNQFYVCRNGTSWETLTASGASSGFTDRIISGTAAIYTNQYGSTISFTTANIDRMYINANGNVGINQLPNTGAMLAVSGTTSFIGRMGLVTPNNTYNTIIGSFAGSSNTGNSSAIYGYYTGQNNAGANSSIFGSYAGQNNTALNLTAVGYSAGQGNTGSNVTAIGNVAGQSNTGNNATLLGNVAGQFNSGNFVTLIGNAAGQNNTAANVTAVGASAAQSNTAAGLSAFGQTAGYTNTGTNVTAIGLSTAYNNSGANLTAMGANAAYSNTGGNNTAIGTNSLLNHTSGGNNTAVGMGSGIGSAGTNTFAAGTLLGAYSGQALTSGNSNTLIGYNAGGGITSGANNLVLGADTSPFSNTGNNQLNIANAIWGNIGSGFANTNLIGINVTSPTTALHVSGTLRIANGGEACDANRLGAIRYLSGNFQVCQNTIIGWENLSTSSSNTTVAINTGVSGSIVYRNEYGVLIASNSLSISSTTGSVGIGAGAPVSLGNNGLYATGSIATGSYLYANTVGGLTGIHNSLRFDTTDNNLTLWTNASERLRIVSTGLVGIGTSTPTTALSVSGTLRIASGAEACDASRTGAMKYESGQFYICRNGTSWETMVAGSSGTVDADRITSGTTSVITYNNTSVTIATNNVQRVIIGTNGEIGIAQQPVASQILSISGTTGITGRLNLQTATGTNLLIGNNAGTSNSGQWITAVGIGAAQNNTANGLTAIGYGAAAANTQFNVTAIGSNALGNNTGAQSAAIGYNAGQYNTGDYVMAMGNNAAQYNSGANLTAIGVGAANINTGANNIAIGTSSLGNHTSGNNNVSLGHSAGLGVSGSSTFGSSIMIGSYAGQSLTSGNSNTLIGYGAGSLLTTGGGNISIGAQTNLLSATGNNQLNIGNAIWGNIGSGMSNANLIGINVASATTALHVSGTLRIASGGELCDTNRLGAIKYQNNAFYVCQNTANGWEAIGTTGENSLADRITSNSQAGVIANATGYISLTTGGVTGTVYFNPAGVLVNRGISTTGPVSTTSLFVSGNTGLGKVSPTTRLDVSGTLRIATGGEACDANRTGAIKYESSQFYICRNGTSWETMVAGSSGTADTDRITSGTTSIIASKDSSITVNVDGNERIVIGKDGKMGLNTSTPKREIDVRGGIYVGGGTHVNDAGETLSVDGGIGIYDNNDITFNENSGITTWLNPTGFYSNMGSTRSFSFTNYAGARLGVNTSTPSTTLDVSGTIKMSSSGESCDSNVLGAMRYAGGQFQVCRNGSTWESLVANGSGTAQTDRITSGTTSVIANSGTSISFTTAGVQRMTIASNGDVGIGGLPLLGHALNITGRVNIQNATSNSTYIGSEAGAGATGVYNIAIGSQSLRFSTASNATALGTQAGSNSSGNYSTFVGSGAGAYNTANSAALIGAGAGRSNTGNYTIALGDSAAYVNQSVGTVAIGGLSLNANTTGLANTAVGYNTIVNNVTGSYNTTLGYAAGQGVSTNSFSANTLLGSYTGTALTTGSSNTVVGANSGMTLTTGSNNILIGAGITPIAATGSYQLSIGNAIFGDIGSGLGLANKIGINVTSPTNSLDVSGTISTNILQLVSMTGSAGISMSAAGDNLGNHTATQNLDMNGFSIINAAGLNADRITSGTTNVTANNNTSISFTTAGIERMSIGSTGAIGIGQAPTVGVAVVVSGNMSINGRVGILSSGTNVFAGSSAGATNTGSFNTGFGHTTLGSNTGNYNVGMGMYALQNNTANNSVAIGYVAGQANAGANLAALGYVAGQNNTAANVTVIGNASGQSNQGTGLTAVGSSSGLSNIGINATLIGTSAGQTNSGPNATSIGSTAGQNNSGAALTAVGYGAGYSNSGVNVTAIGSLSGQVNSGNYLTALGFQAAQYNTTGANNTALGTYAMNYSTTGSNNAIVGFQAGFGTSNTSAFSRNTLMGAYAGTALSTGSSNTILGYNSGAGITTGNDNVVIGAYTSPFSNTGSYQLNIANAIWGNIGSGLGNANLIGINVPSATTALEVSGTVSATRFIGDGSMLTGISASAISGLSSDRIISGTTSIIANNNTGISFTTAGVLRMTIATNGNIGIAQSPTTNSILAITGVPNITGRLDILSAAGHNMYVGTSAGYFATGTYNTGIGENTLQNSGASNFNTAVGNAAGFGSTGSNVTAIGYNSANLNTGSWVTALGAGAAQSNKASYVIAIGQSAAGNNQASGTTAIGYSTLIANTTGLANTGVGHNNLVNVISGSYNTTLGYAAGNGGGGSSSGMSANTLLGSYTGTAITTGSSNTIVGANSGMTLSTGDNNILIGAGITPIAATGSSQLSIGNAIFGNIGSGLGLANKIGINVTSPTTALEVSGTISATYITGASFVLQSVSGSAGVSLTGGGSDNLGNHTATQNLDMAGFSIINAAGLNADRITSGTTNAIVNSASGLISLSTVSTTWGYLGSTGSYLPMFSSNGVSASTISATTLNVSGTATAGFLQLMGVSGSAGISMTTSGGSDNLGNHTATQNLDMNGFSIINAAGLNADRIISGTTNAIVNATSGLISLSTVSTTWGYLGSTGSYLPLFASNAVSATNVSATTVAASGVSASVVTATTVAVSGTTTTGFLQLMGVAGSAGVSMTSGGGSDNLGNHTATQALDMAGFNITGAAVVSASGNIKTSAALQAGNADTSCAGAADYGKIRFDIATKRSYLCRP